MFRSSTTTTTHTHTPLPSPHPLNSYFPTFLPPSLLCIVPPSPTPFTSLLYLFLSHLSTKSPGCFVYTLLHSFALRLCLVETFGRAPLLSSLLATARLYTVDAAALWLFYGVYWMLLACAGRHLGNTRPHKPRRRHSSEWLLKSLPVFCPILS